MIELSFNGTAEDDAILRDFGSVFDRYGHDITRYKPNFIKRRLDRRMGILEINDYSDYATFLRNEKKEFEELITSLSINVTSFFRDSKVYESFESLILPKLLPKLNSAEKIRIWSAGCASGEEPYSIAIMFLRKIGKQEKFGLEIIANDISKKAIEYARAGRYPSEMMEKIAPDVVTKYFKETNDAGWKEYMVDDSVKRIVSFKSSDILSNDERGFDVIFCRNVLIYYEKEAQELILSKFYLSLKDSGYLVLGMDETMLGMRSEKLFRLLMPRERIYQKVLPKSKVRI